MQSFSVLRGKPSDLANVGQSLNGSNLIEAASRQEGRRTCRYKRKDTLLSPFTLTWPNFYGFNL